MGADLTPVNDLWMNQSALDDLQLTSEEVHDLWEETDAWEYSESTRSIRSKGSPSSNGKTSRSKDP